MNTDTKLPILEYGLTVTAFAVPTLLLGMELVNLIDLVYSGLITKMSAVTAILGG